MGAWIRKVTKKFIIFERLNKIATLMIIQPFHKMLVASLLLVSFLSSCEKSSKVNDDGSIDIVRNGKTAYSIVYNQETSKSICDNLVLAFEDLTGASPKVVTDDSRNSKFEIIVGNTGRTETAATLAKVGENGYAITVDGSKVVIVGSNVVWTSLAIKQFEKRILRNPLFCKDNKLNISGDYSYIQSYDDPMLVARLVESGIEFTLNPTLVLNCPGDEGMVVAQGAASDGKHFYFLNRSTEDGQSIVYKYDMSSLSLVGKSRIFNAGHANDATFDFGKNRFIAAHGHSEGKILTPLNPETLQVLPNIDITVGSGAIAYSKGKGQFAISQGGKTLYVTDNDFNVLSSYTRTDNSPYLAQGMGCDDMYVYFPMSPRNGKTDNVLVTYDWAGNYIMDIHIPMSLESESMFYSAGSYYVNFYPGSKKGAALYRVDPVYNYTYSK